MKDIDVSKLPADSRDALGRLVANLGDIAFDNAKWEEAIFYYGQAIENLESPRPRISERLARSYYQLGTKYVDEKAFDRAIESLEAVITTELDEEAESKELFASSYALLADSYMAKEEYKEAMSHYEAALEIHSDNSYRDKLEAARTADSAKRQAKRKKQLRLVLVGAFVGICIIAAAVWYSQYRKSQFQRVGFMLEVDFSIVTL